MDDGGEGGVFLHDLLGFARGGEVPGEFRAGDGGALGDGGEVVVDEFFGFLGLEIAGDDEGGVFGAVEGAVEVAELLDGGFIDVLEGADGDPLVGGAFEDEGGEFFEEASVGLVVVGAAALLFHDGALGFDAGLVDARVQEAFGFDPEGEGELVGGEVEIVVGAVEGGGGVEVASGAGDVFVDGAAGDEFGAFEHEVFEEVGESGAVGPLVFAADLVEDVGGDDGGGVVFVEDDVQTVGEVELGKRDGFADAAGLGGGGGGGGLGQAEEGAGGEAEGEGRGEQGGRFHGSGKVRLREGRFVQRGELPVGAML
ncbi:MAG: hypothetical protein RLZZ142_2102 [Verrucomicrobiota bacterium]